jgi:pimeloyl-ACP methyl ester carboxylesterase
MARLAKRFTVVSVDLRGVGGSTATPSGYDAANIAEDVHQRVSALKLERDKSPFAKLIPKIADGLRANGCTHVETGLIRGSSHYVVEEEPEAVSDLIERYASPHSQ